MSIWQNWKGRQGQHQSNDVAKAIISNATLPEVLEQGHGFKRSKCFTYIWCALLTLLFIWFSVAPIQELIIAQGQVMPISQIKTLHHLEGGLVKTVHVAEGDIVSKKDVLVTLSAASTGQDLKQLKIRQAHLTLSKIRLTALIAGKEPDFSKWANRYPDLVRDERTLYQSARKKLKKEILILQSKLLQRRSEIDAAQHETEAHADHVRLLQDKVTHKEALFQKQLTTRDDFTEAKTDLQMAKGRKILSQGKLAQAKLLFSEAEIKLEEAQAAARNTYSESHSRVARELAELEETMLKFKDRVTRLEITSPFNGIVQQLVPRAPGEVIKPGELVANIVPLDDDMVVQTQISPADIAQVEVGDDVKVKVSAYDPNIFGKLNGKVKKISASTLQAKEGAPYYKAYIHLEKKYFKKSGTKYYLLPGMEVQAEIITGAKSLMKYLFKPVYNSLDKAFVEK